jgi:microsomal dipeptidase-like Zn-dependent dipeptidase
MTSRTTAATPASSPWSSLGRWLRPGGVIGAWPAGFTLHNLDDYVLRILMLVELLGADHVCLGTDMDANYKPVFETYAKMPLLVGGTTTARHA